MKLRVWSHAPVKWAAVGLLVAVAGARAGDFRLQAAGARVGFPANTSAREFNQAEAFADWSLPWRWELGRGWGLRNRLDTSVGWLGDGVEAAIVTAGPSLVLGWKEFPVGLVGGISPAVLTRYHFETKDLGIPFQFASRIGLDWDVAPHLRLSYRYQHMSNAALSDHNPGLNLHLVGVSWRF